MILTYNAKSVAELYPLLIQDIVSNGEESCPRQMPILELQGVSIDIADTSQRFISYQTRDMNPIFPIVELMWYLSGSDKQLPVVAYAQKMRQYANPFTGRFDGAYGKRWRYWHGSFDQISFVSSLLQREPETRRAVMTTYDPILDSKDESLDIPCNNTFQFLLRHNVLNLHVYCRSQDVWYGLPNDLCEWMFLLHIFAGWLNVKPGHLFHYVGSLHLYRSEDEKVKEFLLNHNDNLYDSQVKTLDMRVSKKEFFSIAKFWYKIELATRKGDFHFKSIPTGNEFWVNAFLGITAYNARKHAQVECMKSAIEAMTENSDLRIILERWINRRGNDL